MMISRKIIENHKGTMWLSSKGEGKGYTLSFALPLSEFEIPIETVGDVAVTATSRKITPSIPNKLDSALNVHENLPLEISFPSVVSDAYQNGLNAFKTLPSNDSKSIEDNAYKNLSFPAFQNPRGSLESPRSKGGSSKSSDKSQNLLNFSDEPKKSVSTGNKADFAKSTDCIEVPTLVDKSVCNAVSRVDVERFHRLSVATATSQSSYRSSLDTSLLPLDVDVVESVVNSGKSSSQPFAPNIKVSPKTSEMRVSSGVAPVSGWDLTVLVRCMKSGVF